MLVNVAYIENMSMQFEGIYDYRIIDGESGLLCAVICEPVATRSERNKLLKTVAEQLNKISGKKVYVTADLDVYCDLGKSDCDCDTLIQKVLSRNNAITVCGSCN